MANILLQCVCFRRFIDFFLAQMAQDYDHLTLMQKVEVFEHALSNTNGDDLAKLLWLKSPSSEVSLGLMTLFYNNDVGHFIFLLS